MLILIVEAAFNSQQQEVFLWALCLTDRSYYRIIFTMHKDYYYRYFVQIKLQQTKVEHN